MVCLPSIFVGFYMPLLWVSFFDLVEGMCTPCSLWDPTGEAFNVPGWTYFATHCCLLSTRPSAQLEGCQAVPHSKLPSWTDWTWDLIPLLLSSDMHLFCCNIDFVSLPRFFFWDTIAVAANLPQASMSILWPPYYRISKLLCTRWSASTSALVWCLVALRIYAGFWWSWFHTRFEEHQKEGHYTTIINPGNPLHWIHCLVTSMHNESFIISLII